MKARIFDHIDLRVADMAAAQKFYSRLLPALGFSEANGDDNVRTYQAPGDKATAFFAFEIDPKHAPNANRIAFWAESPAEVERLGEIVRQAGGRNIEGPELCREYSPGYYAVFFEDPSGNKLEICFRESRPS
ncbi:MAG TPA: VOC family protein [Chthoniobacterales bacterium]|jgi:catechol 2,3-dioxygenase-like lactoylglutathione lyase family enzyme